MENMSSFFLEVSAITGAVTAICGTIYGVCRWIQRQNMQDKDIAHLKEEQCLLTYGVLACLKGLKEQGCNGPVTATIEQIEKHINKKAHDQEG